MKFLVHFASRTRLAVSRTNRESEIEIPSTAAAPPITDRYQNAASLFARHGRLAFPSIGSDGI